MNLLVPPRTVFSWTCTVRENEEYSTLDNTSVLGRPSKRPRELLWLLPSLREQARDSQLAKRVCVLFGPHCGGLRWAGVAALSPCPSFLKGCRLRVPRQAKLLENPSLPAGTTGRGDYFFAFARQRGHRGQSLKNKQSLSQRVLFGG